MRDVLDRFLVVGRVLNSSIREIKLPHGTSRYGPARLPPLRADSEVLNYSLQLMSGRVCPVEEILSKQPDLRVLRDPPSLVGRRVRYVLMFHLDPGNSQVRRCKVRAYAWTVPPSVHLELEALDKGMSAFFAQTVFDLAKRHFEQGDPNQIRSGGAVPPMQPFL